jgi:hypothetical protein
MTQPINQNSKGNSKVEAGKWCNYHQRYEQSPCPNSAVER